MLHFDEKKLFCHPQPEPCDKPEPCDRPMHFDSLFPEPRPMTMPERVEQTAHILTETLKRMKGFEAEVVKKAEEAQSILLRDNVTFKTMTENAIRDFIATVQTEVNLFETQIQSALKLFEDSTNKQIDEQMSRIEQAEMYMRENLNSSLDALLHEMEASGTLAGVIESDVMIRPEMFGARGDGETDDTTAVQAAIDSAARTGHPVCLSKAYKITSVNLNADHVTIEGGKIIGDIYFGGVSAPVQFAKINNVQINGTVYLRLLRMSEITGVRFIGSSDWCIRRDENVHPAFHQIGYNKIHNCMMYTGKGFLYLPWFSGEADFPYCDFEITNNTCNPVSTNFIKAEHLDGAKIANNYVQYYDYSATFAKGTAIDISFSDWVNINNNTIFETGEHGVKMENSRHFSIIGNTLGWIGENAMSHGIYILGGWAGGKLQKGIITSNIISQPSGDGVKIEGGGFIGIKGNICRFTFSPVYAGKSAANVTSATIEGVKHYMVNYDSSTDNLIVSENVGFGCTCKVENPNIKHDFINNYSDEIGMFSIDRIKIDTETGDTLNGLGANHISLSPSGVRTITNISGEMYGRMLTLYSANNEGTVIKSGAGNIILANNADFGMKANSVLVLWHSGSAWVEVSRSH